MSEVCRIVSTEENLKALKALHDEIVNLRSELDLYHSRWSSVFEDSKIPTALVGADGNFMKVNKSLCDFFEKRAAIIYNSTWQDLTEPEFIFADEEEVRKVKEGKQDSYILYKEYKPRKPAYLSVTAVFNPSGEVDHFIAQIIPKSLIDKISPGKAYE
jgi:diguanylate cyclase